MPINKGNDNGRYSLPSRSVSRRRQRRRRRPTRAERGNQFAQFLLPLTSGRYLGASPGYRLSQSVRIVKRTVLFHHETHTHFTELHSPMMCATWRQCRGQIVWSSVVIFLLILTTAISGWFVQRSGESWDFGDICSRWYDGGGSCRSDAALTFTALFVLLLPFASGMLVGVTTFARDFERSVWWFEFQ